MNALLSDNHRRQVSMQDQNPSANIPPIPTSGAPQPAQYPYPSLYQQRYPSYTPRSTNQDVIKSGLIGGSIASGMNVLITLLLAFVPAVGQATSPLYQFVPLLPYILSV